MSPADSPARDQAVANLAAHGPLGAALADIKAAQQSLAETRTSLLSSVGATVAAQQELRVANARLEAVRALAGAIHLLALKAAEDEEVGYRNARGYADAYEHAERLIRAALDPTEGEAP